MGPSRGCRCRPRCGYRCRGSAWESASRWGRRPNGREEEGALAGYDGGEGEEGRETNTGSWSRYKGEKGISLSLFPRVPRKAHPGSIVKTLPACSLEEIPSVSQVLLNGTTTTDARLLFGHERHVVQVHTKVVAQAVRVLPSQSISGEKRCRRMGGRDVRDPRRCAH